MEQDIQQEQAQASIPGAPGATPANMSTPQPNLAMGIYNPWRMGLTQPPADPSTATGVPLLQPRYRVLDAAPPGQEKHAP